ncbi:MAG: hypothetical protein H6985_00885 [Pseudomonadales bacterium]|nr:hypothetical protein [Pseudomonadales bacterium]
MKNLLHTIFVTIFSVTVFSPAQAQSDLIYVAVDPCRIADTRNAAMGVINGDTSRNFKVHGSAQVLAAQGAAGACLNPRPGVEPLAIAAYFVATPGNSSPSNNGVVTAYPAGQPIPPKGTASTVNFTQGETIGNTSIVKLCEDTCPLDGTLAVLVRATDYDVVIDVQGYFYPAEADGTGGISKDNIYEVSDSRTGCLATFNCPASAVCNDNNDVIVGGRCTLRCALGDPACYAGNPFIGQGVSDQHGDAFNPARYSCTTTNISPAPPPLSVEAFAYCLAMP